MKEKRKLVMIWGKENPHNLIFKLQTNYWCTLKNYKLVRPFHYIILGFIIMNQMNSRWIWCHLLIFYSNSQTTRGKNKSYISAITYDNSISTQLENYWIASPRKNDKWEYMMIETFFSYVIYYSTWVLPTQL